MRSFVILVMSVLLAACGPTAEATYLHGRVVTDKKGCAFRVSIHQKNANYTNIEFSEEDSLPSCVWRPNKE